MSIIVSVKTALGDECFSAEIVQVKKLAGTMRVYDMRYENNAEDGECTFGKQCGITHDRKHGAAELVRKCLALISQQRKDGTK